MTFTCEPQFAVIPLVLQQLAQIRKHLPAIAADQDIRVAIHFKLIQIGYSCRVRGGLLLLLFRMLGSSRWHQPGSLQRWRQTGWKSGGRVVTVVVVVPIVASLGHVLSLAPSLMGFRLGHHVNVEYLAKNGAAIFAEAGAPGIKGICELHECIAFVHRYSCQTAVTLKHSLHIGLAALERV